MCKIIDFKLIFFFNFVWENNFDYYEIICKLKMKPYVAILSCITEYSMLKKTILQEQVKFILITVTSCKNAHPENQPRLLETK